MIFYTRLETCRRENASNCVVTIKENDVLQNKRTRDGLFSLHLLRQHGFNEVFLQLLMNQLKLSKCFLTGQITIMNGNSHGIHLQVKTKQITS